MGIELFKTLYPGGSDGIGLDENGVPMGAWVTIVFLVGIVIARGTIVEWAIRREIVELGPTKSVFETIGI
jgi:hypothetical protein